MDWFVRSAEGREMGPMSETEVRQSVASGFAALVRRSKSQVWVASADTPFSRPPEAPYWQKRVADLNRREAHALIRSAVAWGVIAGLLFLSLMGGLFSLIVALLKMP
jgi:hypothetical protein